MGTYSESEQRKMDSVDMTEGRRGLVTMVSITLEEYHALKEAAKAALKYVDNLNEDAPVDPNCKECAEVVYYTVGTAPPPLCWIHLLEKAVKA